MLQMNERVLNKHFSHILWEFNWPLTFFSNCCCWAWRRDKVHSFLRSFVYCNCHLLQMVCETVVYSLELIPSCNVSLRKIHIPCTSINKAKRLRRFWVCKNLSYHCLLIFFHSLELMNVNFCIHPKSYPAKRRNLWADFPLCRIYGCLYQLHSSGANR